MQLFYKKTRVCQGVYDTLLEIYRVEVIRANALSPLPSYCGIRFAHLRHLRSVRGVSRQIRVARQ